LVLGDPHRERQQLHDLVSPDSASPVAGGFRKRLLTVLAALRHHRYKFVHLLGRQQRTG
jgi:hypothetical protein